MAFYIIEKVKNMAVVFTAIFLLLGCKDISTKKVDLIHSCHIDEKDEIIHHLPYNLNEIGDSLVGACINHNAYCIYNYYTGSVVKRLDIDTNALPGLVRFAKKYTGMNYENIPSNVLSDKGIPKYEILNGYYSNDSLYLFFYVTSVIHKENKGSLHDTVFSYYSKIPCLAIFDKKFVVSRYFFIDINKYDPIFIMGVSKYKNQFIAYNSPALYLKDTTISNIVYINKVDDSVYKVTPTAIKFDSLSKAKNMEFDPISYDINSTNDLIVSNGHSFHSLDGECVYTFTHSDSEEITRFKFGKKEGFFVYTFNDNKDNYLYYINDDKRILLNKFDNRGVALFNGCEQLVRFAKKDKSYYLEIYKIE